MSVRVVARIRPLLKSERELDIIVRTGSANSGVTSQLDKEKKAEREKGVAAALRDRDNIVRIPNPKNESEDFIFQFNAVYDADTTQQELFDAEGRLWKPTNFINRHSVD